MNRTHLPVAQVEQTARREPENLIFFAASDLIAVAGDATGRYSEDCRLECLGELATRWYLNPDAKIEECFDAVFPAKEWHPLKKFKAREILAAPSVADLPQKLWEGTTPFSARGEIVIRRRLADLLDADGFIPVYCGNDAFFLPFYLEENADSPTIGDAAGTPVENWLEPYSRLFGKEPKFHCAIRCRQSGCPLPFAGHSLMLPLYLAHQRKTGGLPQYDRLRLLSTGAIERGKLKAVATEEKLQALGMCFRNACLFFPESSDIHSEEGNAVPLNTVSGLEDILEEIRRWIEAKGLVVPTFRDALSRLERLERDTRHENQNRWDVMLDRLRTITDAIRLSQDRAPESYLLCLMLKSAMHCHKGDTTKALTFNREAKEAARRLGLDRALRRLEIEELVDLQDIEEFDSIRRLMGPLQQEIEKLGDDDLLMRYYGTIGQAHCCGFLAGIAGFDRDTAKECFQKAVRHAQKLDSEPDIAQDLNYRYLWHVLFDPASEEAARAYAAANDQIERNLQTYPRCRKKNRYFLQRFKVQALYRRLLADGEKFSLDDRSEELPEEAEFWLRALVWKYLGALAAANGEREAAAQYFSKAVELLEGCGNDIIAFIRMTILAEEYRSLREERFRRAALDAAGALSGNYSAPLAPWRDYLSGGGAFPGLNYWY